MLVHLATTFASCSHGFLGFPHWYQYLQLDNKCQVTNFQFPQDLLLVALAIVDILLRIAGLVAVIFVIMGGIKYAASQGNPDATANAQSTIISALIGLVIAVIAVTFVTFIGHRLG